MRFALLIMAVLFSFAPRTEASEKENSNLWEQAIVTLEVTRKQYDYLQPWSRRVDQVQKMATLIGQKQILTTADYLWDETLIRLQKGGRGRWWRGELVWIDYHANLALVTVKDEDFWKNTRTVKLIDPTPVQGEVEIARWRNGDLEKRKADINRMVVKRAKLSFIDFAQLEVDSELNGAGWAEAIIRGDRLVGLTSSKEEHSCTVIPSSFIRQCLAARSHQPYRGLGFFSFVWERSNNPENLEYLKLPGEQRGAIVIEIPPESRSTSGLEPHDVILEIDGFKIDSQGDYKDPQFGNLSLENLANRSKGAGDKCQMKVWHNGKIRDVSYTIPQADFSKQLVPHAIFDQEPEYVMLGGLLFQPLTEPFLQSWGADWARKAPFRLSYAAQEKPTKERPSIVILSSVLPDAVNLGYQDARYMMVDKLNGQPIRRLADLVAAKDKSTNGFHVLEFHAGDSISRLVLDASDTEAATKRVLQRYGIDRDYVIAPTQSAK
jgi:hypothetical protein